MPAYNGIRGYWNEVRVNSNYKSKNAVPQGTELEAGMQPKMEKSRYGFWKPGFLFATLFFAALLFAGCSVEQTNRTKISDLDYTIAAEADIPEELQNDIEEKKAADFKMTYKDSEFLYIVRGYGEQETGGYSICIRDLYLTSNAIIFDTELIGPRKGETISKSPSYPYIVVKVELRDENVVFE